jgi:UDP:flavonoid glycosyltransferase YjiC (YdhE family)
MPAWQIRDATPGWSKAIGSASIGVRASPRFTGADQLGKHLRRLLDEPEYGRRLAGLSVELAQAGGTPRAADIIETALKLNQQEHTDARRTASGLA